MSVIYTAGITSTTGAQAGWQCRPRAVAIEPLRGTCYAGRAPMKTAALLRLLLLLAPAVLWTAAVHAADLPLDTLRLPAGFSIALFARVDNARQMALGSHGTLFVGSMQAGKVVAVTFDEHYRATGTHVLAHGLNMPVGVAFRDGALYVSAVDRILRLDDIERRLEHPPQPVTVSDRFPHDTHHGWKFIAFGPDGWLYVPVGAPCNICAPDPARYAN